MKKKQHRSIVDARKPRTGASGIAFLIMFVLNDLLILFPFFPEGGIGQAVVKAFPGELIVRERTSELDVLGEIPARIPFQSAKQHARHAYSMGFGLVFPIRGGHEVFGPLHSLPPQNAGSGVYRCRSSLGRDLRWMEVDVGKIQADLEQDTRLVGADHGVAKVGLLENDPCVVRKLGDIVLKILACFHASEGSKRVFGGVVERRARNLTKNQIEVEPTFFICLIIFSDFRPYWFENAFEPSQGCQWADDFPEAGVFENSPEIIWSSSR